MPISGHEESGVKSFAGQFSDLVAGVPIKKRRPRPSSPPSEEPCSITEETELQRKENSSTSQGSTISNVSIAGAPPKKRRFRPSLQASSPSLEKASPQEKGDALRKEHSSTSLGSTLSTSSAGLSDTIRNPVLEEKNASSVVTNADIVLKNSSFLVPKLEESNPATPSCLLDVVDSKEKVVLNEGIDKNSGSQTIKGNPELLLAAKAGLALGIGAGVSKQIVQDLIKQEGSVVSGSTNLSLSLKEHFFPAVTSPAINEIHKKLEKGEPVSLELSLSKEECSTHSSNTDSKSNSDTTRVHSSRANWDLNTTMDAWDEASDASSVKTSIDGLNITHSALDENQLTCSIGITPPVIASVKQTFKESQNKAFITSSAPYGQHHKCVDPRNLCLSPYLPKYDESPCRISVKLNSGCATPIVSLPRMAATAGDANTSSFRLIKPEPLDDNPKKDLKEANVCPVASLDSVAVKKEFIPHSFVKPSKSTVSNSKLVAPTFIKSEPGHEGRQERSKTAEISTAGQLVKLLQHGSFTSSSSSSSMAVPAMLNSTQVSAEGAHLAVKSVFTAELATDKNIVGQLENCIRAEETNVEKVYDEVSSNAEPVPLVTVAIPMVGTGTKLTNLGLKHSSLVTKKKDAEDHDGCRLKLMNELPDPRDSAEDCVSDEEKITLSADMLEDDSYGSDFESDDNHAVTVAVDTERYIEDDDYEDGEVREPLEPSKVEDAICEVREVEHRDSSNYDNKPVEKGVVSGDYPTSSRVVENNNKTVIHNEIFGKDGVDILMHEKPGKIVYKNVCVQESLDGEKSDIAADNREVNVLQRKPLGLSERIIVSETQETEQPSDGSHVIDVQCADEVLKTTDTVRQTNLDLSKMEGSANNEDITKDVGNSGNQGRIIDLSRAASSSSPSKTRPISGRSLPTRAGRDVLSDTLDCNKLYRGRDEVYIEAPTHKFSRERHQDMSTRNSRMNFGRGRGRVNSRIRGDWESEREYSGEFYNGPSQQFRGARSKYQSAIADNDLEYNNVGPDDSYVVNGRLGRKPLNDGSYIAPRRRSPGGGRDGIQMGHRNPRPVSPNSRCIGGDGSEIVGMRHSDKFMRGFPDDTLSSVYTRPQQFEGMDGRFSRGRGRNFSSMQRRGGISRMRSKSPIRSRSRSPGQWSSPRRRSPRRRSPEGFGGHQEMTHRRSPLYRVDRMRSPDRPVFSGERVVRRHGSPPFISRPSNDMRDIDSARDHGHPRSVISNRSPSGRILIRNNRRFDVVDPRDRADNDDEYFNGGGPMHSGRMLELNGEGNGEERRRFGERRGPVRSFRPPYNNNNNNNGNNAGDNFHLNAEDGPRHYRFCSDNSDFHERSNNMRERDFDRRIKGRTGNGPPRRTRNMDDQEENFRHGGQQVWSDDSFDDISRVKRKRF